MLRLDHSVLDKLPRPGSEQDGYRKYRSVIPVGQSGDWAVERFEVEVGLGLLRLMRDGRGTPPGQYTRLTRGGRVIMSDTDAEIGDHREFFNRATGRVLIHGLGLGVAVCGALAKKSVTGVDVVELSADVIRLVGPHVRDDRLTIHHDDCTTKAWPKGSYWNVVWHDIWDDISEDNLPQMALLGRKFGRRCDWQGCWAKEWIRR